MVITVAENYDEFSKLVADKIAGYINKNPDTLVCLSAGNTPLGAFAELLLMQKRGEVDLSSVWYVGLDEWVGLGKNDEGSCIRVMFDSLYDHIPGERIQMFDGLNSNTYEECNKIEAWIDRHNGIGLSLLGIGLNGHIGFNEPGTPNTNGCFAVELDEVTRSVSKKYFGKERPVTTGITIGWQTLSDSREVILIANGKAKAGIVKEALKGEYTLDVPASMLQKHNNLTVILDKDAAALLD